MYEFDTHDEAEVARQVEYLLFDIESDPEGAFVANMPQERAYTGDAVAATTFAPLAVPHPVPGNPPIVLEDDALANSESRTELRKVISVIMLTRAGTKNAEHRRALHHYLGVAYARLDVLVQRDGA